MKFLIVKMIVIVLVVLAQFITDSSCSLPQERKDSTDEAVSYSKEVDKIQHVRVSGTVFPPDVDCQVTGINYGCTEDGYCFKSCSTRSDLGEYCYTTSSTTQTRSRCNRDDECSPIWDCAGPCGLFLDHHHQTGYACASYGCEGKKCWSGCDLNQKLDDEWCFTYSGNATLVKACNNNAECRPNYTFGCFSKCVVNS